MAHEIQGSSQRQEEDNSPLIPPRKPVAALGDNHGCDPVKLREDLCDVGIILPDGCFNPFFVGYGVQMGDTVDRGKHSLEIFNFWRKLQAEAPEGRIVRLLGNHEIYHLIGSPWIINAGPIQGLQQLLYKDILDEKIVAAWMEGNTLYTHAGVDLAVFPEYKSKCLEFIASDLNRRLRAATAKMLLDDPDHNVAVVDCEPIFSAGTVGDGHGGGIFWARQPVRNDQFRQVVGHTPQTGGIYERTGTQVKFIDAGRLYGENDPAPKVQQNARAIMLNTVLRARLGR